MYNPRRARPCLSSREAAASHGRRPRYRRWAAGARRGPIAHRSRQIVSFQRGLRQPAAEQHMSRALPHPVTVLENPVT
jgi:hypothetical protein